MVVLDQTLGIQLIYSLASNSSQGWMPGEGGNRRGTGLSLLQKLSQFTSCILEVSRSDVFVYSAMLKFLPLWVCPASLWTCVSFLTSTTFCINKLAFGGGRTKLKRQTLPPPPATPTPLFQIHCFCYCLLLSFGALDCHLASPYHSCLFSLPSSLANKKVTVTCNSNQPSCQRWDFFRITLRTQLKLQQTQWGSPRLIILKISFEHSILYRYLFLQVIF